MNHSPGDGIIRITKDEALDPHVDDMLKRQMSLRGQPGVTREHGRKWFYQSWFIFLVVGMLGAFVAWAILEPFFDDMHYYQGTITEVNRDDAPDVAPFTTEVLSQVGLPAGASITVRGQKFFLLATTKELAPDGKHQRVDYSDFEVGQQVGIYSEYLRGTAGEFAFAGFIVRNPPSQSSSRAALSLEQLVRRSHVAGFVLFAVVAGFISLFIGAADGLVCRLPRRAFLCGGVGLLVGLVGGLIAGVLADIAYSPLNTLANKQMASGGAGGTFGFAIQIFGRAFAWGMAGTAMGLGQGIALRSSRLLLYGMIGGIIGGLLGGFLFDPIDMILIGGDKPSSHWSRLIGILVIGGSVGALIGVVELMARDAWLRMTQGPLTGKEFLIFKDVMNVGSSPRSDIYLFNDPMVAEHHAVLRAIGDACEIESRQSQSPVLVNSRAVTRARLRHGDNVTIGKTVFVFQQRKG